MTNHAPPRTRCGQLLALSVERESSVPIFRQIYLGIRNAITSGRLSPGSQLPATRDLASRLEVSRTSVLSAFELLHAEGYVEGKLGAGTFVSSDIEGRVNAGPTDRKAASPIAGPRPLSALGRRYHTIGENLPVLQNLPFNTGFCSPDPATMAAWRQISSRQLARNDLITSSTPILAACCRSGSRSPSICGPQGWSTAIPSASSSPRARNRRSTSASAC